MKRAIRTQRSTTSRKEFIAKRIADLSDQKKMIDKELSTLKGEVPKHFAVGERCGRVVLNEVNYKIITDKMKRKLEEDGVWEDIMADPSVDMKKLDALIKSCPHYKDLLEFDPKPKVEVKKADG
ncbi:MAG: hypothetical protein ABIH23_08820 [bacterium]